MAILALKENLDPGRAPKRTESSRARWIHTFCPHIVCGSGSISHGRNNRFVSREIPTKSSCEKPGLNLEAWIRITMAGNINDFSSSEISDENEDQSQSLSDESSTDHRTNIFRRQQEDNIGDWRWTFAYEKQIRESG
jgi:hypothetical protein